MSDDTDQDFDPRYNGWCIKKPTWHFHHQLHARYGVVMRYGEFSEMLRDIRTGRAELLERRPGREAVYAVLLAQSWKRVFVAVKGGQIVTALPPNANLRRKWKRFYNG